MVTTKTYVASQFWHQLVGLVSFNLMSAILDATQVSEELLAVAAFFSKETKEMIALGVASAVLEEDTASSKAATFLLPGDVTVVGT